MSQKNLSSAIAYYNGMNNKDLSMIEKYLHVDVHLISPLAEVKGKDAVLNSINHFMSIFNNLVIRSACSNLDQVMIAYNLECPDPLGTIKAAVLLTFQNDLIIGYELFYDARPFVSKKEEIFGR